MFILFAQFSEEIAEYSTCCTASQDLESDSTQIGSLMSKLLEAVFCRETQSLERNHIAIHFSKNQVADDKTNNNPAYNCHNIVLFHFLPPKI